MLFRGGLAATKRKPPIAVRYIPLSSCGGDLRP